MFNLPSPLTLLVTAIFGGLDEFAILVIASAEDSEHSVASLIHKAASEFPQILRTIRTIKDDTNYPHSWYRSHIHHYGTIPS